MSFPGAHQIDNLFGRLASPKLRYSGKGPFIPRRPSLYRLEHHPYAFQGTPRTAALSVIR